LSPPGDVAESTHFAFLFEETIGKEEVKEVLEKENPRALEAFEKVFHEALKRDLWRPRSNSVTFHLHHLGAHHGPDA